MSNNNKMKGLLKGLRYISQIFDNEKEPEMQIGFPTDVKHVAHIGWDGPSVNSPSWMNEFKAPPGFASAPLSLTGAEETNRRGVKVPNSPVRDLPSELPKASRRQHSASAGGGAVESPTRDRSEKSRQRRSSKNIANRDATDSPRQGRRSVDSSGGSDSPARNLPDVPKKSRRKKSKECAIGGGSSRSRSKAQNSDHLLAPFSGTGTGGGYISKAKESNERVIFDEGEGKGLFT
ncbi:hypothetical protein UlMin_031689 [Ulmus minor]